ncbi:hypothetical protein GCM10011529_24690 [Polymorphobacter glacialis]|uniref:Calx-beta domain-containing protein n=1 Tax=Sandarakinorhabdus glacialis TaxID=1614636 RepID=A0A916ZX92_9SPHN|nr:choice-of-anchor I family protein [Polymorphobacter glacialis]GGE17238.1 hypothetical protein GCM10011529_24690 [Polymorphobacter glacialis]
MLGDLNEFTNEESLAPLGAVGLAAMSLTLAETERYSYSFEGNAQELDQVYVSGNLTAVATLDIVHVNSEFVQTAMTASEHDPSVLALNFAAPGPAAGDIAFVGFSADRNDDLAFVALKTLAAGTVIYFNDQEWQGSAFNTGEGQVTWTATSDIPAGTIVTINSFGSVPVSNFGTTAGSSGLGSDGEIVYAYVGAAFAPTTFLAAIANDGFTVSGGTLAGTGLVVGQTAIDLGNGGTNPGEDVAIFNGVRNGATNFAGYLAAINNPANWLTQDGAGDQSLDGIGPDLPFSLAGFTTGSIETQTVGFQAATVSASEGNAGTTAYTFTVARSGGTAPTSFSGSIAAGATTATITINVAGDTLVEANENFALTLSSVTNSAGVTATIPAGTATATATIVNDDAAPSGIAAGDIAFVGFNADGNDDLAFVALKTIATGTVIYFNDQEWLGSAFNTGEGQVTWTATSDIAAGTIVTINSFSSAPVSNFGTTAGSSGLGSDGEIVYAYVGAAFAPTTFLAAVANDGFAVSGGTLAGTGLVVGQTAIDLGNGGTNPGEDVAMFNGARDGATTFAGYLAAINNPANWLTQDGTGDQSLDGIGPDLPFSLSGFTIGTVETQTVGFQNTGVSVAEDNAGTTAYTFTIVRSGGTTGQVDFSGSFAPGTTDTADYAGGTPPTSFSGSIAAGATSATITINVAGDTLVEASESFSLTLNGVTNSAGTPVALNANTAATGTIVNDDFPLAIGGINVYDAAPSLAGSAVTPTASDDIVLVRMGSIAGTVAGAESIAYEGGRVYATNIPGNAINVHSVTAAGTLVNESPILLSALPSYLPGGVNAVDIKNGIIAVGYENINPALAGFVALFNAADNSLIKTIQVGVLPDDVTFSPDGTKLLVANEGEALSAQGTISIIDLSGGAASATVTNTISFASLNGAEAALRDRGLAIAPGQPAAGDIEPEYITISADGTRAYVTLQEVNGVAVIDLADPTADKPLSIQPLGTIDRNLAGNALDTSDQDGGISIRNVDVHSLLQPDAIASFDVGGATYFITANEGDARVNITDSVRLGSAGYVLDPTLFPNAAAMKANADLGRLNVLTTVGDTDGDGDFDVIHTLGGRGISIFKQEADGSITKVRETGGEFEAIIAANHPTIFNSNQSIAASSVDARSDDKGPEPEGVTIGVVNGRTYAFVGLERVGGYMVYDVTDPANAVFVTYKPQTGADLGPETSVFISAANSPTGQALLLSGQEISNTVTLYSVQTQSEGDDVIYGGADGERWNGRGGNDVINGNGGNDIIDGGAGNDLLNGGEGIDTASYASATAGATVTLANTRPQATGGAGTDTLTGFENLLGSAFDDLLYGDTGNNRIDGGAGNDIIIAARGNDILSGGGGTNILQGGVDADVFSFDIVDNGAIDIITDFGVGSGDTVLFGPGVFVTDVKFAFLSTEATVNGFDVRNGARSIDLVLTLSSAAGTQQVHVLDAYGFASNNYWENMLGVDLTYAVPQPLGSEIIHIA